MCFLKSCLLTEAYMDFYVCLPLSVRSPYDCSVWKSFYILVLQEDLYYPHPFVQDVLWATLHKFVEPVMLHWPGSKLREKALVTVMEHVHYEDENTRYICIGPVNKVNWGLWLIVESIQWYAALLRVREKNDRWTFSPLQKKVESSFVLFLLRASEELCCITRQCAGNFSIIFLFLLSN